jgi:hypothetical protein
MSLARPQSFGAGILTAFLLGLALASAAAPDDPGDLRLGERMYREGVLPSGNPMQASVKGDVPAQGTMFSCVTCHLRSGMGSVEGAVAAPSISGPKLYAPRLRFLKAPRRRKPREPAVVPEPDVVRPAYTDATLARALREGIDPSGRTLDPAMPRYRMEDRDLTILVRYLKTLSAEPPPGVTDETIRFASVVTEGVEPADRKAMLDTLEAYLEDRNAVPRRPGTRARAGAARNPMHVGYVGSRRLELVDWELRGPSGTWRGELEDLQRAQPVFGLLGGMVAGEWRPIHEFCEEEGVPCLFPITELPVVSGTDWHTLYFSKGLYGEGETAARYVRSVLGLSAKAPVLQLLRDTPEGRGLAQGFEDAWTAPPGKRPAPQRRVLEPRDEVSAALLETVAGAEKEGVAVLWLPPADLSAVWKLMAGPRSPRAVFVSSGLLGGALDSIPEPARSHTYITYPGTLPEEQAARMEAVESWHQAHNVALTRPAVQSRAYFVGSMLSAALARMGDDLHRDYLLDVLDMMTDQTFAIAPYERLSFGHAQRYASKGCYIVQLGPGPRPALLKRSEWVVR